MERYKNSVFLEIKDNPLDILKHGTEVHFIDLIKYIEKHKLCADYIFANWKEFLELLYSQGSYVEEILWFEYVRIDEQVNSLGGGGYKDTTNPEYMYAETYIHEIGLENKSLLEIEEYIESVIASYPHNNLMPSFFIAE